MFSSWEALEGATVVRSGGFQPKVKPRVPGLRKEKSPPSAGVAPEEPCLEPSQGTARPPSQDTPMPPPGPETPMNMESSAPCWSFPPPCPMPDVPLAPREGPKEQRKRTRQSSARGCRSLEEAVDPALSDLIRIWLAEDRKMERESAAAGKRLERARQDSLPTKEREAVCQKQQVPVPQVKIVNGQVVLDPNSLHIAVGPAADDVSSYRRIEETHTKLNNHSYMKKVAKVAWKREETEAFFKALEQFGSDFEAIRHFFPTRTRQAIRLKFKAEERRDPRRVTQAMLAPRPDVRLFKELVERLKANTSC